VLLVQNNNLHPFPFRTYPKGMKVAVKKTEANTMLGVLIVSFFLQFRAFWNVCPDATSSVTERSWNFAPEVVPVP